jgi:uncharacterized protein (TIGR00730 family)
MAKRAETNEPVEPAVLNRAARMHRPTEDEKLLEAPTRQHVNFTQTDPWRVLRITGEFVEGFDALAGLGRAVTLFGSARVKPQDPMYKAAAEVARLLGEEGFAIITGGGPGIMEAGNKGAREAGVCSVGLGIELPFEQALNPYVDLAVEFRYFFVRKMMLVKYAEAFVIFPGGFGTLDELFESLALIQTGKVRNFPVILFGRDYWKGLIDWIRKTALAEGKISPPDLDLLIMTDSPGEVRDRIVEAGKHAGSRVAQEKRARAVTRGVLAKEGPEKREVEEEARSRGERGGKKRLRPRASNKPDPLRARTTERHGEGARERSAAVRPGGGE